MTVLAFWDKLLNTIQNTPDSAMFYQVVKQATPESLEDGVCILNYPNDGVLMFLEKHKLRLEELLTATVGAPTKVKFEFKKGARIQKKDAEPHAMCHRCLRCDVPRIAIGAHRSVPGHAAVVEPVGCNPVRRGCPALRN